MAFLFLELLLLMPETSVTTRALCKEIKGFRQRRGDVAMPAVVQLNQTTKTREGGGKA